ncbi:DUF2079 domain-containing protein [Candidatus Bathyarchaeota archaeon]|nr:DUF2079 domain-containing protein [Candidatus Bathyarchaeota archaeon]
MRIDKNFIKSPVFLATIVYISVFSFLTTLRYYSFVATAWDLGEFSQSMWTTLHAKKLFYNNVEFGSHFHVHFRPILFLLLPIYALFESPVTLLVLKSILLGFGAIPLYLISKQELKNHFAILFPFLYLLYPALHGANWFDFHPENFVPFFILMSFYYYKKDKTLPYFFFLLLALMTKEDVSLVIISLGLYFLIVNRKLLFKRPVSKEILTPLVTIILGFLWFLFSLQIIQYFLQVDGYAGLTSSGYVHFGNAFGRLGGNGGLLNIVKTVVTNPLLFFQVLFSDYLTKIIFLLALFLPVAFLSFVDIKTILLFSPTLMIYLLADSPNYYSISYQYSGLLVPGIFISAIYGMKKLGFNKSRLGALNIEWIHSHTRLLLISAVVMGVIFFSLVPSISGLLGTDEQSKPIINYHRLALLETLSYIPPNASVLTQREIFPHLSHRLPAYVYYNTTPVEYILIDTASYWYENSALAKEYQMMYGEQPPFPEYVEGILTSGKYGLLIYWDGIYLFKEGYRDEPIIFK